MSSTGSHDDDDHRPAEDNNSNIALTLRKATVYDAVAGRLTNDRFIRSKDFIPSTRDTTSSSHVALPSDEALFRSSSAPVQREDSDVYDQARDLENQELLPTSDLLKAIHSYSSDFYAKTAGEQAEWSYQSLDGSALIALGILLEESCNTMLGDTGHLALLEDSSRVQAPEGGPRARDVPEQTQNGEGDRPAKRRKV